MLVNPLGDQPADRAGQPEPALREPDHALMPVDGLDVSHSLGTAARIDSPGPRRYASATLDTDQRTPSGAARRVSALPTPRAPSAPPGRGASRSAPEAEAPGSTRGIRADASGDGRTGRGGVEGFSEYGRTVSGWAAAHSKAGALLFREAVAQGPRANLSPSRRTSRAPAPPKCAGTSSSRSSAACPRIRRRLATACSGARQALLLQQGCRICTGLCSRSPTKTARSLPDARRSTDDPGVCDRARTPG